MEVDLLPARLCLWKDDLAEQGEGLAKEGLGGGVVGGEGTRTWFPPENKRQGSSNSFAFISQAHQANS